MFGSVISSLVVSAIKTTVKSSLRMDELIAKLKEACPPQQELQKIINQKNQLSQTLGLIQTNVTTINSITTNIEGVISTIDPIITVIKSIPIPSSVPPGVGVPVNLIVKLSDTLELLKDLIKQGKVSLKGAKQAFKIISDNLNKVLDKLNQLDAILTLCAAQTGFTGSISDGTSGLTSTPGVNVALNEGLENSLSPNSPNPLNYKGWRLILQTDPNNKFSFPRRRVIAQKNNPNGKGLITLTSNLGPPGSNGYSYSSDTQVLVDDIKFRIDNPNWEPESVFSSIEEIQDASREALLQAEEAKRGKVVFYGRVGDLSSLPLGDPSGYDAGEYSTLSQELRPEDKPDRISSARIGRGLRLTIYKSPNFYLAPGQSNTPVGINSSYATFEHPLNSSETYLEVFFNENFNNQIESFIIQKLPGGLVTDSPSVPLPVPIEGGQNYVLKRKSLATLLNQDYAWVQGPVTVYDVYVKNNGIGTTTAPTLQTLNQYKTVRAIDLNDAKEKIFDKYGLNNGVWGSSNFENVFYKLEELSQVASFSRRINGEGIGTYYTIDNLNKVNYAEQISF